ncbi:chemotaxis protein CheW [Anabaena sp. UHCC 0187]|uniref:chemotaxis protein CheW n=1 Tax=Anabaena sp. UHCC 0187 TaxID=2590018 RepID=UPI00144822DF|nr:chemotaxis protein CheW [Anabaena sp. UHCC 0187]MTJ11777.1 chemotaxis protein CheW [Anabaena sp. UHCC 0187]
MKEDSYVSNAKENNGSILNTVNIEPPVFNDCWNQIGVKGDRTCGELKTVIHCYECPVYAAVGDSLLEREPPADYLENWINILEETSITPHISDSNEAIIRTAEAVSIIIFRLGKEQLGLPVKMLQEVTHPCIIQPLPHRSNELFLGLVNIRGETLLCASLSYLLHIQPTQENINNKPNQEPKSPVKPINLQRMIVAGQGEDKWVFPVDEVHGIFRFHLNELQDVPVVISKSEAGYTKGIVYWEGKKINYLDSDLLFYTLNHKIL